MLLEVIVQSIEDARAADAGGADRLEVVRDLTRGGLTPPLDLVRRIAGETSLPLRVMVRENDGYGVTGATELRSLQHAAEWLANLGVDGIVAGFARGGELDLDTLRSVMTAARESKVTFHRAFDDLADPIGAIHALRMVSQVDRILTAGGRGDIAARCRRLREYAETAGARVAILAGGGVGEEELQGLRSCGAVREVHVGRAARENGAASAPVSATRVRRLRRIADAQPV